LKHSNIIEDITSNSRRKQEVVSETPGAKLTESDHKQHPVGRVGKPEDIANACVFLSDVKQSGFITGQNIIIDGGMTTKMIYV